MKLRKIDVKAHVSLGVAVAALALSSFSFYTTNLRITDDVRVVSNGGQFAAPDFQKKEFEIYPTDSQFIFINAGARPAITSGISLLIDQPESVSEIPRSGCGRFASVVNFDAQAFVLRPGDMLARSAALIGTKELKKETRENGRQVIVVPFSQQNAKSEKIRFKLCVDVAFTTPSVEYGVTTITAFEDVLDSSSLGYAGYVDYAGDGVKEQHRPVQLIKRTGLVYFD
ncbi:MAG: hypothetical protein JO328_08815 [Hyphomicrobiales bacterium]|nr:hypothetical protein [Hyphomicrobiales bacterium]MBV9429659.1 hypothetical protein [Bradyrhizobiaceae bacterium]